MRNQIRVDYNDWLIDMTCTWCREWGRGNYFDLMQSLSEKEFKSTIYNDRNRAMDGLELRMQFVTDCPEKGYSHNDAFLYLTNPCSMLEMMAALAIRCEDHIMWDPEAGDRTGLWFYTMINNMGLAGMVDGAFDELTVEEAVDRVVNHTYAPNGEGGLFQVENPDLDMRYIEIWYQLNRYLNQVY